MRELGRLSVLVRLGIVVVLIPFAIWESIQRSTHDDANRIPQQKLTRAYDILRMWERGVSPNHVPYLRPLEAASCLRDIAASQADAGLKDRANGLLTVMDVRKHYFAFADNFEHFKPEINKYLGLYRKRATVKNEGLASFQPDDLRPQVVVISMGHRDTSRPMMLGELEPHQFVPATEPFLDAELIEACGDQHAQKPADVRTLIVLEWNRTRIGEYKLDSLGSDGVTHKISEEDRQKSGFPEIARLRFREGCALKILDYPSGQLLKTVTLECTDPESVTFGGGSTSTTGYEKLRGQVKQFLANLTSRRATSDRTASEPGPWINTEKSLIAKAQPPLSLGQIIATPGASEGRTSTSRVPSTAGPR